MSDDVFKDQLARHIRIALGNFCWIVRSDEQYGGALGKLDDDGRARLLALIETEGCEGMFRWSGKMVVLAIKRSDGD